MLGGKILVRMAGNKKALISAASVFLIETVKARKNPNFPDARSYIRTMGGGPDRLISTEGAKRLRSRVVSLVPNLTPIRLSLIVEEDGVDYLHLLIPSMIDSCSDVEDGSMVTIKTSAGEVMHYRVRQTTEEIYEMLEVLSADLTDGEPVIFEEEVEDNEDEEEEDNGEDNTEEDDDDGAE